MYTAVAISDDTTPPMRKTLSYFYLGFERQYCSIFRSFNLNEWKVDPSVSMLAGILTFESPFKTFPLTFLNEANRVSLL